MSSLNKQVRTRYNRSTNTTDLYIGLVHVGFFSPVGVLELMPLMRDEVSDLNELGFRTGPAVEGDIVKYVEVVY